MTQRQSVLQTAKKRASGQRMPKIKAVTQGNPGSRLFFVQLSKVTLEGVA